MEASSVYRHNPSTGQKIEQAAIKGAKTLGKGLLLTAAAAVATVSAAVTLACAPALALLATTMHLVSAGYHKVSELREKHHLSHITAAKNNEVAENKDHKKTQKNHKKYHQENVAIRKDKIKQHREAASKSLKNAKVASSFIIPIAGFVLLAMKKIEEPNKDIPLINNASIIK